MKLFGRNEQCETPKSDLHEEIERVKLQMDTAYSNFQSVTDPDLIDCYIFECNAACKRYHFLLKQVKML